MHEVFKYLLRNKVFLFCQMITVLLAHKQIGTMHFVHEICYSIVKVT